MEVAYFFDTYAVIELIEGNPRYAPYKEEPATLTVFNLVDVRGGDVQFQTIVADRTQINARRALDILRM